MTQAYFLIPGLLLPACARGAVDALTLARADCLSQFVSAPVQSQQLAQGVTSGSVHLAWAWQVITRKPLPYAVAAFEWIMQQGPELSTQVWRLRPVHLTADACLTAAPLPRDSALDAFCSVLRPVLDRAGFMLQRWDRDLYVTRKKDWNVVTRTWQTLQNRPLDTARDIAALDESDLSDAQQALALFEQIRQTLAQTPFVCDGTSVDAVWICDGGHQQLFFPPTKLRSVLSDNPAIIGWAQAAGILNHRTGRTAGARQWPGDAPSGECLAVLESLYAPWLAQDWTAWSAALDGVVDQLAALRQAAAAKGCDSALVVACGMTHTHSFSVKTSGRTGSLLARLAPGKKLPADTWIFEE